MFPKFHPNLHLPFWLITLSVIIGLTIPVLIQDGMFMDAMLYTSVSHNLSQGIGSFWFPQFSLCNVAGLSSFHEQPPLVFGIQAVFFYLFGHSMYVERFYTFITMVITAFLMVLLWKEFFKEDQRIKNMAWLPLLLWITIPVSFWTYSNNMHENTMGIFTLCAVWLCIKALNARKHNYIFWILSGFSIFFASFSKGLPGFFPIGIPFLYWIIFRSISLRTMFYGTSMLILVPTFIYSVLFWLPASGESLSLYFYKRVLHRINDDPTVNSRFYILGELLMQILAQIVLTGLVIFIAKVKKTETFIPAHTRLAMFFICTGITASAPLMLTLVQKGFYFVPALPFFAIGMAILIAPAIAQWTSAINTETKKFKSFLGLSALLIILVSSFALLQKGKKSRDKDKLHDIYLMGEVLPHHSIIGIQGNLWDDWSLQCYMMRYFNISLNPEKPEKYFLTEKFVLPKDTLANYEKINLSLIQYDLYEKKPGSQ